MFAKLLKHEFKSQAKLFLILSLAALGAGGVGCGMLSLILHLAQTEMDTAGAILGVVFSAMLMVFMFLAVMAYSFAVSILLVYRFYKYHFSDEGYLTFTLPATTHQILLSGLLNFFIWQMIAGVVVMISAGLIFSPLMAMMRQELGMSTLIFNEMFLDILYTSFDAAGIGWWYIPVYILSVIFSSAGSIVLILLSVTIGCVVAKKHKVLASIGIYYGINMVLSIITSIVSFAAMIGDFWAMETTQSVSMNFTTAVPGVLYLIIGVVGYFLMHRLVEKKLNLP